jgi:hypothetical protein
MRFVRLPETTIPDGNIITAYLTIFAGTSLGRRLIVVYWHQNRRRNLLKARVWLISKTGRHDFCIGGFLENNRLSWTARSRNEKTGYQPAFLCGAEFRQNL